MKFSENSLSHLVALVLRYILVQENTYPSSKEWNFVHVKVNHLLCNHVWDLITHILKKNSCNVTISILFSKWRYPILHIIKTSPGKSWKQRGNSVIISGRTGLNDCNETSAFSKNAHIALSNMYWHFIWVYCLSLITFEFYSWTQGRHDKAYILHKKNIWGKIIASLFTFPFIHSIFISSLQKLRTIYKVHYRKK